MALIDLQFDDARIEGEGLITTSAALTEALTVVDKTNRFAPPGGADCEIVVVRIESGTLSKGGVPVCDMEPGDYVITRFGLARFLDVPES